jgi:phosphoribosyl-AMP cyclohydrolase
MPAPPPWLAEVKWTADGLVAAIVQDHASGRVLMFAWMDRAALEETAASGYAVFWSRSRRRRWRKGEQSGHVQRVRELRLDCDGDAVLLRVEQEGGIACHTGRQSCFFRRLTDGSWEATDPVLRDPAVIYGDSDR